MLTSGPASADWVGGNASPQVDHILHRSLPAANDSPFPVLSPSVIKKTEINWVIGMILGAFCYGILLSLGLRCLGALRSLPRQPGFLNQRMLLMLHVTSLIILNAVFEINTIRQNIYEIFYTRPEALTYFYLDKWNLIVVLAFGLTDGLLVWRCYMVQKVLLRGRKVLWHHLFWIFPLSLWFILVSVGASSIIMEDPSTLLSKSPSFFSMVLLFICILGNILLNLFATCYIVVRLLIHRRSMMTSFGHSSSIPKFHLRIISILLESAIINLPVAIVAMVCAILVGGWGHLLFQVAVPAQSFSSVLVIYQVARGRAIGSESIYTKGTVTQHLDTLGESMHSP